MIFNWAILFLALLFSVSVGGAAYRLLERRRPQWSPHRRKFTAACTLPALILLAALLGMLWELVHDRGDRDNMQDLAIAAYAFMGLLFGLIALGGGVIGAGLARKQSPPPIL